MPRTASVDAHRQLHKAYNFDSSKMNVKVKNITAVGTQTRYVKKDS